jgi:hypothetical protein
MAAQPEGVHGAGVPQALEAVTRDERIADGPTAPAAPPVHVEPATEVESTGQVELPAPAEARAAVEPALPLEPAPAPPTVVEPVQRTPESPAWTGPEPVDVWQRSGSPSASKC